MFSPHSSRYPDISCYIRPIISHHSGNESYLKTLNLNFPVHFPIYFPTVSNLLYIGIDYKTKHYIYEPTIYIYIYIYMILYGWFIGSLGPWDRWHRPAEPVRDPVRDPVQDPWDPWDPPWLRGWRPLGHPSRNLEINGNQGFDWKKPGEICDNLCLEHWQCTSTSSVSVQMMFYVFFHFFSCFLVISALLQRATLA